jgi:hypothetical protein
VKGYKHIIARYFFEKAKLEIKFGKYFFIPEVISNLKNSSYITKLVSGIVHTNSTY